jgi:hypothetical protein
MKNVLKNIKIKNLLIVIAGTKIEGKKKSLVKKILK